ncbi:MAG: hypothetical protein CVT86_01385 [Alphaproteobacteria bacterium HGW-Alphaproteobacteria-8]|jgi:hypothetical protein|nr:MAG: hypothetical protein CVT86_01385 [Alphaproteobacteria bacterium HGW-Alphaproteobacteria-8]
MTSLLVEPPDEFSREAYARALREAEALPNEDPDKAELVAVRRADLESYFDRPPRSAEERARILRGFMPDGPA